MCRGWCPRPGQLRNGRGPYRICGRSARSEATASATSLTRTIGSRSRSSRPSSHVPIPITGLLILSASAISESVPNSPPTATTASELRATIALRASPNPVAIATVTYRDASSRSSPGKIPIDTPPTASAPRAAAFITPPSPPHTSTHPASASARPSDSAVVSSHSVALLAPITAMYGEAIAAEYRSPAWAAHSVVMHRDQTHELVAARDVLLQHDPEVRRVHLERDDVGLQPRPLVGAHDVAHPSVRHPQRAVVRHDPRLVLRVLQQELLAVGVGRLRVVRHEDAGLPAVAASEPGSLTAHHVAVRVIGRGLLAEVPRGPVVVVGVEVVRGLVEPAVGEQHVADDEGLHALDRLRVGRNAEMLDQPMPAFRPPGHEHGSRLEREVRVRDGFRESSRVDAGVRRRGAGDREQSAAHECRDGDDERSDAHRWSSFLGLVLAFFGLSPYPRHRRLKPR